MCPRYSPPPRKNLRNNLLNAGRCPCTPPKGFPLWKPRWGLCPRHPWVGALPPPPPPGAPPLNPGRGPCPRHPRKGHCPLTLHPKPKGLGDCLYVGFSLHDVLLCEVRVSPSRATKGLSDRPLETFGPPSDEGILACLLRKRFSLFRQKLLTRMQTEGVQGAIGKPPGCPGKDKPNP